MKHQSLLALALLCCGAIAQDRERDPDEQQAQREHWFYDQRAYPLGHIPTGARLKAIEALNSIDRAARSKQRLATTDSANWTPIGPRPTDQGTTYVTAGRVAAIAIDPRDNNTVYIGAAEGGIWKTTDGGATWKPLTDQESSLASGAIVLDPVNPDTVYVGTGEENFASDSYYGAGILKSTDGGNTWTNIVGPFLRARIGAIAIHPADGRTLLCTTQTGVWRSTDSAANWVRVLGTSGTGFAAGTAVVFDPTDGNIVYAALGSVNGDPKNGVYKSTDAGNTWRLAGGSGANALPVADAGRIDIGIAPSNPSTLYVSIQDSSSNNFGALLGIWKSTDAGSTWNKLSAVPASAFAKQLWYDNVLRVHPKDPGIVIAGALPLFRTMDGGTTWQQLPAIGPNKVEIHVDQHALAFTPDGSKLYIGNDGGVYSTTDLSSTTVNWTQLNDTLAITQFYPGMSLDAANPDFAVGGAQDNGIQRYTGKPSWENIACGDGGFTVVDELNTKVAFGACQNIDIRKTSDGGTDFFSTTYGLSQSDRVQFIAPLVIDPGNPENLYFGTYRVWRSMDGGGRWNSISPDLTVVNGATLKSIAIAPSDSKVIYTGASDGTVQWTNDAGANWTIRKASLPSRAVTQIVIDPIDPATAYASFSGFSAGADNLGHVFRTRDSGANWTDISGNMPNIPVNGIVLDGDLPDTLYAGTDAGVLITSDGGATWSSLGFALPRVVVDSLVLHRSARILRAGTHGRSAWDIAVPLSSPSRQPRIASISPKLVNAGGSDFRITITGSNFTPGVVVRWNGQDRPTIFMDSTHLAVQIPASDLALVGRVAVSVFINTRGGGVSNAVEFAIGPAPSSKPEAFVSAANPTGGDVLAPRSIASLYGLNLAAQTAVADLAPPLPVTLGGTTLTLDGNIVPLFFVSPGQINFQVPLVTIGRPIPLVISHGALSTTIMVTLTNYAPALFTTNAQGTGQASTLVAGTASLAAPLNAFPGSRPAKRGESISIYGTGLGDVSNRPGLGSPSPSNPLASTLVKPTVTIGGVNANVSFAGLAPGFVGLYQVNAQVPDTAPGGGAVDLVLTIGGVKSNTATIAIEP
jgi:uncharacterized protein (TIGR03437 family)